jgi:hypothetical protein
MCYNQQMKIKQTKIVVSEMSALSYNLTVLMYSGVNRSEFGPSSHMNPLPLLEMQFPPTYIWMFPHTGKLDLDVSKNKTKQKIVIKLRKTHLVILFTQ